MKSVAIALLTIVLCCLPADDAAAGRRRHRCGFVPLFDGQTLAGWQGAVEGYRVEEGVLISTEEAGNLYTDREYADFVLRFEFKLTPGSNNGIGVRTPMGGRASYQGMEIQILDDTAEKHAKLKPWQFHGSVYGVAAAQMGALNPVGEWNCQEILCCGSWVRVTLNGVVILDTDVSQAATPQTVDGKEHPGLERSSGHILLCGHRSQVEFRNLCIQELCR